MSEKKKVQRYENDEVIVQYNPDVCEHAAECVKGLPQVFNVKNRPWINVNGASMDEIVRAVDLCPSGALTSHRKVDTPKATSAVDSGAVLTLIPNGPIRVAGKIVVMDDKGEMLAEVEKASLCRCGYSKNKPFCDGSHARESWQG